MDEHTRETLDLIEASSLSKEEKQSLKDQLQSEGMSESFFTTMNERLIAALEKIGNLYEKIVDEYEARDKSIQNDHEAKKNEIEEDLNKKLAAVDIADLIGKEKIFMWYRKETEANQGHYDRAVKTLFADLSRQAIID